MFSIIGISLRGKTYFLLNNFSDNQLNLLKDSIVLFKKNFSYFSGISDDLLMKQFIRYSSNLLNQQLEFIQIDEILVIK